MEGLAAEGARPVLGRDAPGQERLAEAPRIGPGAGLEDEVGLLAPGDGGGRGSGPVRARVPEEAAGAGHVRGAGRDGDLDAIALDGAAARVGETDVDRAAPRERDQA